jgi:fatty-acyl-CoA synthase
MVYFKTVSDKKKIEQEMEFEKRFEDKTMYSFMKRTVNRFPNRPALSFQLKSGPKDSAETLTWSQLSGLVTQAANCLKALGINDTDTVAYILPNCNEAVISFLGGVCAGIVCPISPLLGADQMAGILNEIQAKVVITLAPFPKTDVAQKVDEAVRLSPKVKTVVEVDLKRYLSPPLSWVVSAIRPKLKRSHSATIINFSEALSSHASKDLDFKENNSDRVGAYFHTGGTTGMPKVAKHNVSGMLYQGWSTTKVLSSWSENECVICPLPMFHVFAVYPMLMTCVASGSHIVFPTPQGYRGDGVFDNFWKLVERWRGTFMVMVPTAATALMQRPVNADVSTLKYAICGSAPLPSELFNRFESATGLKILEGYGMTEAVCLISVNPPDGERKIGSVGIPFPYTDLKILETDENGKVIKKCKENEVGEICLMNPGVQKSTVYTQDTKNKNLYADKKFMRTGDLGHLDKDGYLWISGRAKDIIIRGGHNIDPVIIEDGLAGHPAVAMVGAIGQPDSRLGEVPSAYVELVMGSSVTADELMTYASTSISDKLAVPQYIEILAELPKTPVGKIFKPDLRKSAITRIYNSSLKDNKIDAEVVEVVEDKILGLVAKVRVGALTDRASLQKVLGDFIFPWHERTD